MAVHDPTDGLLSMVHLLYRSLAVVLEGTLVSRHINLNGSWNVQIITLFPEAFPGVLNLSLTGKALQHRIWTLSTINLRDFGVGKHKKVDAPSDQNRCPLGGQQKAGRVKWPAFF